MKSNKGFRPLGKLKGPLGKLKEVIGRFHPLRKLKAFIGKIGTLNLILILVGAFFLWFNWEMLKIFQEYGTIPETYACAVIAATIGECGICGWIRTNKDRKREHQWEQEEKQAEKSAKTNESEATENE